MQIMAFFAAARCAAIGVLCFADQVTRGRSGGETCGRGSCKKRGMEGRGERYRRTAGVESREEKETAAPPPHSSPSQSVGCGEKRRHSSELCDRRKTQHAGNQEGGSGRITKHLTHSLGSLGKDMCGADAHIRILM